MPRVPCLEPAPRWKSSSSEGATAAAHAPDSTAWSSSFVVVPPSCWILMSGKAFCRNSLESGSALMHAGVPVPKAERKSPIVPTGWTGAGGVTKYAVRAAR